MPDRVSVAVLIPCYNEEVTIAEVVRAFRKQIPDAQVYVFDNNSSDNTVTLARQSGAIVCHEPRQGKGYVLQSMFRRVDADIYVLVDGDGTYPAREVHNLISPVLRGEADMVVGSRLHAASRSDFKSFNRLGNRFFLRVVNYLFGIHLTDMLSGYRCFNRAFVKTIPIFGGGFEVETELTLKALYRGYRIVETPIDLRHRPEGSHSKIRIVRDGVIILHTILSLLRDYKPLTFFGAFGLAAMLLGLVLGAVVVDEFLRTGLVLRLPSAIMAVGLLIAGMLLILVGLVLHSIARRFQELSHELRFITDAVRYQRLDMRVASIKEVLDGDRDD